MKFYCSDLRRLEVLKNSGSANAIEFIEVLDRAAPPGAPRQQTLFVRLLRTGFNLSPDNIRITGGVRVRTVGVLWCAPADQLPAEAEPDLVDTVTDPARTLVVRTDERGDFSTYTFSIVASSGSSQPPLSFDPRLSSIDFSFKVECPTDFDCAQSHECPPVVGPRPQIDYLAKDYQGFRRLMLDRLSLLAPGWTERSAADLGITLVELLAYAADNLSYRQDVIANEAYLATARKRVSVRRHARLVDYYLHEGCNARAFVHFDVVGQNITLARGTQLLTRVKNAPTVLVPDSLELGDALASGAQVFESVHEVELDEQLNKLEFYAWGDEGCCLPRGSTRATLRGHIEALKAGDFLVFEEVLSPTTQTAADADRTHRCVVRLTEVTLSVDPSGQLFDEPSVDGPVDITEIAWSAADALPFPLCLSVAEHPGIAISVALGNIVLADHGASVIDEPLGTVSKARFRPTLSQLPLTHGFDPDDLKDAAASLLLQRDPHRAMPRIILNTAVEPWIVRRDLLSSPDDAPDFVAEIEDDGYARLRFGDDNHGKRPNENTTFTATYRVGNGTAGNVGAEAIAHIVSSTNGTFNAVRNPVPAGGGIEPEDIESARRDAPHAFRTQERAVTAADYDVAAKRLSGVQRAATTYRWTGSWYTAFVTPDRLGGEDVDESFATQMRRHLERFRIAGYDLDIKSPRYVSLYVSLHICVRPDYLRSDVLQAVKETLSRDVFHPDQFSFGQPVYLSRIIAAAQAIEGVDAVRAERFERFANPGATSLDEGVIAIGGLEIARLANDPNFPEHGRLILHAGGGR